MTFWPLDPEWKKSGSGMKIPDKFFESLENNFLGLKIFFLMRIRTWVPGFGIFLTLDSGSRMEIFESGINIPDPKHRIDGIISQQGQAYGKYMEFIDAFPRVRSL
jgi:hypothetical protein